MSGSQVPCAAQTRFRGVGRPVGRFWSTTTLHLLHLSLHVRRLKISFVHSLQTFGTFVLHGVEWTTESLPQRLPHQPLALKIDFQGQGSKKCLQRREKSNVNSIVCNIKVRQDKDEASKAMKQKIIKQLKTNHHELFMWRVALVARRDKLRTQSRDNCLLWSKLRKEREAKPLKA